jgi:hypothetical protein
MVRIREAIELCLEPQPKGQWGRSYVIKLSFG